MTEINRVKTPEAGCDAHFDIIGKLKENGGAETLLSI
jgi:hypothetical protein